MAPKRFIFEYEPASDYFFRFEPSNLRTGTQQKCYVKHMVEKGFFFETSVETIGSKTKSFDYYCDDYSGIIGTETKPDLLLIINVIHERNKEK